MKLKEFDVVKLKKNHDDIFAGTIGTIVMIFDTPEEAYEVEFIDKNSGESITIAVKPEFLEKVKDN